MYSKIIFIFGMLAVINSTYAERRAVSFVPEVADGIIKAVKECMLEYDNDPKVVKLIRAGSYGVDDKFKKFIHCAYYRSGYSNKDGTILVDKVISAYPMEANIGDVTRNCSEMRGVDHEDNTFQFFKCFETHAPIRIAL